MSANLHPWCLRLITGIATAPLVESNTRRELLCDVLQMVDGGTLLAEQIEDLAHTMGATRRQSGVDLAIEEAIGDAATLLARALGGVPAAALEVAA